VAGLIIAGHTPSWFIGRVFPLLSIPPYAGKRVEQFAVRVLQTVALPLPTAVVGCIFLERSLQRQLAKPGFVPRRANGDFAGMCGFLALAAIFKNLLKEGQRRGPHERLGRRSQRDGSLNARHPFLFCSGLDDGRGQSPGVTLSFASLQASRKAALANAAGTLCSTAA
jgi:hypothetical protein